MPRNSESPMMYMFLIEFLFANCMYETPTAATIPNKIQKIAAKIGNGIDAKKAPNFPNMEKKIINPVDIWITLLLPTFVSPRSPMFSTDTDEPAGAPKIPSRNIPMPCKPTLLLRTLAGGGVAPARRAVAKCAPVDSKAETSTAPIIPNE